MKQWFDVTQADQEEIMKHTTWNYADLGYFRGGGYSSRFVTEYQMPATMIRLNLVDGLGPVLQIAEGWTVQLPDEVTDTLWKRTDYTWPCTWFTPRCDGKEGSPFKTAYEADEQLGRQPWRHQLWPHRRRSYHPLLHAAYPRSAA